MLEVRFLLGVLTLQIENIMLIRLNNGKTINIVDACLIVKDGMLFNTVTKQYEGVDGDRVTFHITRENGGQSWLSGIVDGYTCNRRVKLRGSDRLYAISTDCIKAIDHQFKVTNLNEKEKEVEEEDWETILSAQ